MLGVTVKRARYRKSCLFRLRAVPFLPAACRLSVWSRCSPASLRSGESMAQTKWVRDHLEGAVAHGSAHFRSAGRLALALLSHAGNKDVSLDRSVNHFRVLVPQAHLTLWIIWAILFVLTTGVPDTHAGASALAIACSVGPHYVRKRLQFGDDLLFRILPVLAELVRPHVRGRAWAVTLWLQSRCVWRWFRHDPVHWTSHTASSSSFRSFSFRNAEFLESFQSFMTNSVLYAKLSPWVPNMLYVGATRGDVARREQLRVAKINGCDHRVEPAVWYWRRHANIHSFCIFPFDAIPEDTLFAREALTLRALQPSLNSPWIHAWIRTPSTRRQASHKAHKRIRRLHHRPLGRRPRPPRLGCSSIPDNFANVDAVLIESVTSRLLRRDSSVWKLVFASPDPQGLCTLVWARLRRSNSVWAPRVRLHLKRVMRCRGWQTPVVLPPLRLPVLVPKARLLASPPVQDVLRHITESSPPGSTIRLHVARNTATTVFSLVHRQAQLENWVPGQDPACACKASDPDGPHAVLIGTQIAERLGLDSEEMQLVLGSVKEPLLPSVPTARDAAEAAAVKFLAAFPSVPSDMVTAFQQAVVDATLEVRLGTSHATVGPFREEVLDNIHKKAAGWCWEVIDHAYNHLCLICPVQLHRQIMKTFVESGVFTVDTTHDKDVLASASEESLPPAWRRVQLAGRTRTRPSLPQAYGIPKPKKAWAGSRPIVPYVRNAAAAVHRCAGRLVAFLLNKMYQGLDLDVPSTTDARDTLVAFSQRSYRRRGQYPFRRWTLRNQDLKGFFTTVPATRIREGVQRLVREGRSFPGIGDGPFWVSCSPVVGQGGIRVSRIPIDRSMVLRLQDLPVIVDHALAHNALAVGDTILRQGLGMPMGSPMSPAVCRMVVSLQEADTRHLLHNSGALALRYADNRLTLHSDASGPSLTEFVRLDYYGLPIELENEDGPKFLSMEVRHWRFGLFLPVLDAPAFSDEWLAVDGWRWRLRAPENPLSDRAHVRASLHGQVDRVLRLAWPHAAKLQSVGGWIASAFAHGYTRELVADSVRRASKRYPELRAPLHRFVHSFHRFGAREAWLVEVSLMHDMEIKSFRLVTE